MDVRRAYMYWGMETAQHTDNILYTVMRHQVLLRAVEEAVLCKRLVIMHAEPIVADGSAHHLGQFALSHTRAIALGKNSGLATGPGKYVRMSHARETISTHLFLPHTYTKTVSQ